MDSDRNVRVAVADAMAERAGELLRALMESQLVAAVGDFDDVEERTRWFYTPTDHGGLALSSMSPAQQQLVFRLVASGLSRPGYVTATTIVGLDNVLDELEGWSSSWGRERGRDPGLYFVRVFGAPRSSGTWSWRFGGHHVSLNFTIVDGAVVSSTPSFFGADPASSPLLGPHPLRPLAGAEDYARELLAALTPDQRAVALVSPVAPCDLAGANRSYLSPGDTALPLSEVWRTRFEGALAERVDALQALMEARVGVGPEHLHAVAFSVPAKGISVASFTSGQRDQLRRLLHVYLGRMPDALAEIEARRFDGNRIEDLSFLWAGGMKPGQPHYYRIQGSEFVVEYDNAARDANHVHTVWRELHGDFGTDALAQHYAATLHRH